MRAFPKHPLRAIQWRVRQYFYRVSRKLKFIYFRGKVVVAQHREISRLHNKKQISVVFFVIHESVWKYDSIYRLMMASDRFMPLIVICPYMDHGEDVMTRDMERAHNYFLDNGYNVVSSYNRNTKEWLDVRNDIDPDIVFFTNPHDITKDAFLITNFLDKLTCYTQYSFHVSDLNEVQYNQLFHNLLWRFYCETPVHYQMAIEKSDIGAKNVRITGYPGVDKLLFPDDEVDDDWKISDRQVKRIIWAPHHTIEDSSTSELSWSCFLLYSQLMLDLLETYKGRIQICFKPHPILRSKLERVWEKAAVDEYYQSWETAQNGQLQESAYLDLFLTSDALIHDSGSFAAEYLCVDKPALFTVKNKAYRDTFNRFGKMALDHHYIANNEADVVSFVDNLVSESADSKSAQRKLFIQDYLIPISGVRASETIFNNLLSDLS